MKPNPLGKGLRALFEENNLSDYIDSAKKFIEIPVDAIQPNPFQPREEMGDDQLESLKRSIQEKGLIQPIAVRQIGDKYEIVAGERRWRAIKALHIATIPAYVLTIQNERQLLELSLIENLNRENLNPIEIASGYKRLSEEFKMTQEEIAEAFSINRTTVTNFIRVLKLPEDIQNLVKSGELSFGHARALLALPTVTEQHTVTERILKEALNVRQTEALIEPKQPKILRTKLAAPTISQRQIRFQRKSAAVIQLEDRIRTILGSQVRIKPHKEGGKIEIDYYSPEDLERLMELFVIIEKNI
jgi:ParB family chromosome partitioning protein